MKTDEPSDSDLPAADTSDIAETKTWDGANTPSTAVIESLAEATGTDPLEMPPLYDAIDTDALDSLLTKAASNGRPTVSVTFEHDGVSVSITSDGDIDLR